MKDNKELQDFLTKRVGAILEGESGKDEKLKAICKLLKSSVSSYDWVGFYVVDKRKRNELVLGPYEGEPTEHVRIPFGKGICGHAAELKKTYFVENVSKETNYLSCSPKVKSEIVVPIFVHGEIVGELDIDSHTPSAFTHEDKTFLEEICKMVSRLL